MRRWELLVGSIYTYGHARPGTRHWTRQGALRRAELLRVLGPDLHFYFTLRDRRTGETEDI
ncbi:hypothetical protein SCMU_14380 [Sinomonas cyclohexanicum]|uniref:Uncharacterized protein n=1 Tax=Sinomonas cyclohexanicum TaxID=322009 RepID=A0ABN6FG01_SINCY|nr:hypothetical protein [Corynebacterium cyclohexanicum]BCT75596.1 hypothetical protein SCMU_14380 [Corynebacterium cyclohexanicum]